MIDNAFAGGNKKSILLIDDDEHFLYVLKVRLEQAGYLPFIAKNWADAEKILNENKIDLIVLDIILPKKNGYEICYELKKNEKFSMIPVIMLSQKNGAKDRYDAARVGADGYISKPFEAQELIYKIEVVLNEFNKGFEIDFKKMFFPMDEGWYVLIIDDSPSMRQILKNILGQLGIVKILETELIEEAMNFISKEKIKLIFCGLDSSNRSKIKFLDDLKKDMKYQSIPVVVISNIVDDSEKQKILEKGIDFVAKPFSKSDIKKVIERIFKKGEMYA